MKFSKSFFLLIICLLICWGNNLIGQTEKANLLSIHLGIQHISLLDRQASPILYSANGPQLGLRYQRRKASNWWEYELQGGLLPLRPTNPELRFQEFSFSGTFARISVSHLRMLHETGKWQFRVGGLVKQEVLIDFYGIGNFPWILAQGGLYAKGQIGYQLNEKHHFSGEFALPIFSWITDMPYNQIPRLEGRAPDVLTILQTGTRIPYWHNYQRFDLDFIYTYDFHTKWNLIAQYHLNWFHDSVPKDLWSYQGMLTLGLGRKW